MHFTKIDALLGILFLFAAGDVDQLVGYVGSLEIPKQTMDVVGG